VSSDYYGGIAGELADQGEPDDVCPDCGERDCYGCDDEGEPCFNCGEPGCPGYCDDYQTYNLRPAETGGQDDRREP
jgi:hypothetical protein